MLQMLSFFLYPSKYRLVRRAEVVAVSLAQRYSAQVVVPSRCKAPSALRGAIQREVHDEVGVDVGDIGEYVPDGDVDAKFPTVLAHEGLFLRLARFDLASHKLPQQTPRLMRRPLAYRELPNVPDNG